MQLALQSMKVRQKKSLSKSFHSLPLFPRLLNMQQAANATLKTRSTFDEKARANILKLNEQRVSDVFENRKKNQKRFFSIWLVYDKSCEKHSLNAS